MGDRINHAQNVARRKLGELPDNFEFYRWEVIGPDTVVFTGGPTKIISRGPRKGKRTWIKSTHKVAVTDTEEHAEMLRYESEKGKCGVCGGDGQEWAGWHYKEGNRYKNCRRCGATGNPPLHKP